MQAPCPPCDLELGGTGPCSCLSREALGAQWLGESLPNENECLFGNMARLRERGGHAHLQRPSEQMPPPRPSPLGAPTAPWQVMHGLTAGSPPLVRAPQPSQKTRFNFTLLKHRAFKSLTHTRHTPSSVLETKRKPSKEKQQV